MRARGERSTDRELDLPGRELAAEHQHVDHLPGGLLAAVARLDGAPELIEAPWPVTTVALLPQREEACERPGLARKQIEIVIQLSAPAVLAGQPLMRSDDLAVVGEHDISCADLRTDIEPSQARWDRVAV